MNLLSQNRSPSPEEMDGIDGLEMTALAASTTDSPALSSRVSEVDDWEFEDDVGVKRDSHTFDHQKGDVGMAQFNVMRGPVDDSNLCSDGRTFANCFISFIGVGILGLPHAFMQCGIYAGSICIALIAIVSTYCMLLVVRCKYKLADRNASTYGDIGFYALGRWGQFVVETSLVVTQTGFCTAYLIFISTNIHSAFPSISHNTVFVLCAPVLIALALVRHLKHLAPFSIIADVANIIGLSVVYWDDGIHFGDDVAAKGQPIGMNLMGLPFFFGVAIYCYEGVGMVLPIENSMRNKSHYPRILTANMLLITFLFISFGLCGYLAFGETTSDIITLNLPNSMISKSVKVSLCIGLYFTYPIMLFPAIQILEDAILTNPTGMERRRSLFRATLVVITVLVAMSVPKFGLFISLIGSSCCSLLAFVLPCVCYLKLHKGQVGAFEYILCLTSIAFGVAGGVLGTLNTINDIRREFLE